MTQYDILLLKIIFTDRGAQVLTALACALGGRAGAHLVEALSIRMSHDTFLRLIRRRPEAATQRVRILGVDDWRYRRGKRYGTILLTLFLRVVVKREYFLPGLASEDW